MGRLTTHVLDTARGRPGAGIAVGLYALDDGRRLITRVVTNTDGRTDGPLLDDASFRAGRYEIEFAVGDYFAAAGADIDDPPFLDDVVIRCRLRDGERYHVPLLVSPWCYSTYRGS
jgi:5-hydroxyisourate hydrolase